MFKKILIANRGEIVERLTRTCRRLSVKTVVIYSEHDRLLPYVATADEAVSLGWGSVSETYLNSQAIIEIARAREAQAIHPGYGFLSEDPIFAEQCASAGITFIGPSPATLRRLGEKDAARNLAASLGIPVPEGIEATDRKPDNLLKEAKKLGAPWIIKATTTGGGRGMRLVQELKDLPSALESVKREAAASFRDAKIIIERVIAPARHIEVQLIGDSKGNVLHFFERDCSAQRRYQKVIEIAPAELLDAKTRESIFSAAIALGKAGKLCGAATAEFLLPLTDSPSPFYFLEVNPRLQVEHPITEQITGLDLVELQLRVACGESLPLTQNEVRTRGAAIELRVYAEIPELGFIPSGGKIEKLAIPQADKFKNIRLEHALVEGALITTEYDPMLAKVCAWGETFLQARASLRTFLAEFAIFGPATNLPFLQKLLDVQYPIATQYLEQFLPMLSNAERLENCAKQALAGLTLLEHTAGGSKEPFYRLRSEIPRDRSEVIYQLHCAALAQALEIAVQVRESSLVNGCYSMTLSLNGEEYFLATTAEELRQRELLTFRFNNEHVTARLLRLSADPYCFLSARLLVGHYFFVVSRQYQSAARERDQAQGAVVLVSPLPGKIAKICAAPGAQVTQGEVVMLLESMKIEHPLCAPGTGQIKEIKVQAGEQVQRGQVLAKWYSG